MENELVCRCCGKTIEELAYIVNTDAYLPLCDECLEQENIITCAHCGQHFDKGASMDGANFNDDGTFYCSNCMGNHFLICHECGVVKLRVDMNWYNTFESGEVALCEECRDDSYICESCDVLMLDSNNTRTSGYNEIICPNCYDREDHCDDECEDNDRDDDKRGGKVSLVNENNTFDKCLTKLTYGIELETSNIDEDNDHTWSRVHDGSIRGMEFVSPILNGDKGFSEIKSFLGRIDADYDLSCGYHIHLGLPNTKKCSPLMLAKIIRAYKKLEVGFFSCVDKQRIGTHFCKALPVEWTEGNTNAASIVSTIYGYRNRDGISTEDIISLFDKDKYNEARYYWVNPHSVFYRGTLEIRSHQGTLDYNEITKWICLHGCFIEWCIKASAKEVYERMTMASKSANNFVSFVEKISSKEIADYYSGSVRERWKETTFLMKYCGINANIIVSNSLLIQTSGVCPNTFEVLDEEGLPLIAREHTINEVSTSVPDPIEEEPIIYYGTRPGDYLYSVNLEYNSNFNGLIANNYGITPPEDLQPVSLNEIEELNNHLRIEMPEEHVAMHRAEESRVLASEEGIRYRIPTPPSPTYDCLTRFYNWTSSPEYRTSYGLDMALELGTELLRERILSPLGLYEVMLERERGLWSVRILCEAEMDERRMKIVDALRYWESRPLNVEQQF